jgi:hypothetical protein
MRPTRLAPFALTALLVVAALARPLAAQDDSKPKGKIDDVEHSAEKAKDAEHHGDHGHDRDHGGGLFGGLLRGMFFVAVHREPTAADSGAPAPEPPGQGYLAYPYAGPRDGGSFVLRDVASGRDFGSLSGAWFWDDQSTLRSAQFALEGAYDAAHLSAEYAFYREKRPDGTDYLHLFRLGAAYLPRLGDVGYLEVGLALQGVMLGSGRGAGGPGVELGLQLFPARPLGLNASARFAALTWEGGPVFGTGFADLMANGSVFVGRVELLAGYRWTRVGVGAPFRGPVAGMKVWF